LAIHGRSSPYRIEINPWLLDVDLARIIAARGAFVAAVGELETSLTEVAIRLSRISDYYALRTKFPSRRKDRIKFLKQACEANGPYMHLAPVLQKFLSRFEAFSEYRDLLAHARMRALSGPDDSVSIVFSDYYAAPEGVNFREERATLRELERKARRVCRCVRAFNFLFDQIRESLPPLTSQN
jgi:hypothetical protein